MLELECCSGAVTGCALQNLSCAFLRRVLRTACAYCATFHIGWAWKWKLQIFPLKETRNPKDVPKMKIAGGDTKRKENEDQKKRYFRLY